MVSVNHQVASKEHHNNDDNNNDDNDDDGNIRGSNSDIN